MRLVHGLATALLLGGAAATLTLDPLGAQDIANARYDPGRWSGGFMGISYLPRRLRASPNMDPNQIVCARRHGNRICRTRGQWAEIDAAMRRTAERTE